MHPISKGDTDDGQGDSQGSKTGLGIDGLMNAHALLIGVGRCKYSEWSLPVTVDDALALRETLADPDLSAYPKDYIRVLSDEAATREGILAAVDEMARAAEKNPDATFLVYYSGHGWQQVGDDGESYFLIPHDVRPHELASSALPAEDFIRGLRSIRGRRVLVMMDTCHAAAMADAKNLVMESIPKGFAQEPLPKAFVEELTAGKGRAVFLSCGEDQKSWILPGEDSLSIFTHHLLAVLKGAGSSPQDKMVTVSSLMRYLGQKIPESAREIGQEQTPFFKLEAEDYPVAAIRGGKGLPAAGDEIPVPAREPVPATSSINIRTIKAGTSVVGQTIGKVQLGSKHPT